MVKFFKDFSIDCNGGLIYCLSLRERSASSTSSPGYALSTSLRRTTLEASLAPTVRTSFSACAARFIFYYL